MSDHLGLSLLIGRTIVECDRFYDVAYFTCSDGNRFRAYHMLDCCESVRIYDRQGNIDDILNSPVESVEQFTLPDWPADVPKSEGTESFTWTIHKITTRKGSVAFRWLGESNGYYSESVYFDFDQSL